MWAIDWPPGNVAHMLNDMLFKKLFPNIWKWIPPLTRVKRLITKAKGTEPSGKDHIVFEHTAAEKCELLKMGRAMATPFLR
jgi:hypothetical protein